MAKMLKIAAIAAQGFFRIGRFFPQDGVTVPVTDLTEADLERIRDEKNLHVTVIDADAEPEISDEALRDQLKAVIADLPADAFGQDGKPKLDPLRTAVPEGKDRINAKLRDEVWAELNQSATPPAGQ